MVFFIKKAKCEHPKIGQVREVLHPSAIHRHRANNLPRHDSDKKLFQQTFSCLKSATKTLENGLNYFQS